MLTEICSANTAACLSTQASTASWARRFSETLFGEFEERAWKWLLELKRNGFSWWKTLFRWEKWKFKPDFHSIFEFVQAWKIEEKKTIFRVRARQKINSCGPRWETFFLRAHKIVESSKFMNSWMSSWNILARLFNFSVISKRDPQEKVSRSRQLAKFLSVLFLTQLLDTLNNFWGDFMGFLLSDSVDWSLDLFVAYFAKEKEEEKLRVKILFQI